MKWEKVELENFVEFYNGKSIKPNGIGEYPAFGSNGLIGFSEKFLYTEGVILGRVGAYCGAVEISKNNFWASDNTIVVKPKENADLFFLYYLLKNFPLNNFAGGAAQPLITQTVLKPLSFNLPPLLSQRKIASILLAYDDLIENNLKRIKLLEEKAFSSYKLIVKSEKMEKVRLGDIAQLNKAALKSNSNLENILYVDIASVSTGCIDNKTQYTIKDAPGRAKRIVKHGDIIWSCVRPNRKSYSFVWQPEENLIVSTGFAVISAKEIPSTFLYQIVTSNEFVSYLENNAKGATYPAVTSLDFENAIIEIAPNRIMQEYQIEIEKLFELKLILQQQNTHLREARDILLPRLMNRTIEI